MSRKNSVIKRIDINLDLAIKKKQKELSTKENKPITYVDTCKKISDLIAKINIKGKIKL